METVYVMAKASGSSLLSPVKVGMARNAVVRLQEIRTSCPFRIELAICLSMPSRTSARALERAFHNTQASRRLHGEWFDMEPEEAIRLLCFGYRVFLDKLDPNPDLAQIVLEKSGVLFAEQLVGRYEVDEGVTLQ